MQMRTVPITDINPAPYNPRVDLQPGDLDYEKLKASIVTFGYEEMTGKFFESSIVGTGHFRAGEANCRGIEEDIFGTGSNEFSLGFSDRGIGRFVSRVLARGQHGRSKN